MKFNLLVFAVVICAVIVENEAQRPTIGNLVSNFFQAIGGIFRRRPSSSNSSNVAAAAAAAAATSGSGVDQATLETLLSSQATLQSESGLSVAPVVAEPIYITTTVTADPVYITSMVTADPVYITSMVTQAPVIERLTSIETQFEYVTSTIVETVYATEKVYDTVMQTAYVTSTVMQDPVVAEPLVAENAVPAENAVLAEPYDAIVVQATPLARMMPFALKRSSEIEASEQ